MRVSSVRSSILALAVVIGMSGCSGVDTTSATTRPTMAEPVTVPTTEPAPTTLATTVPPPTSAPTTSPPSTQAKTTAPATTEPDATDDEAYIALASPALLDLTVFPDGWEATPATEDDEAENERFADRVDDCLGNDGERVADQLQPREANSPEFTGPGDSSPSVEQQIIVADDEDMAITAMADVGAEGADVCLEQTIQEFFDAETAADIEQDGVTLGSITVERIELDAPADEIVGYRVEIPVEAADGQSASGYLQVLYQREGRTLSQLRLSSFSTVFDPRGIAFLTGEVVSRLATIDG